MLIYFVFLFTLVLVHAVIFARPTHGNEKAFNRKQTTYFVVCAIALTFLMGLRAVSVGRDLSSYYDRYENYVYMLRSALYKSEFGFNYFNFLFNRLGVSWQIYLVITSAIISFISLSFFKKYTRRVYLSLFLFMTIGSFSMAMSGLRQTLAACFCLMSFMIFETKQYKWKKWKHLIISLLPWVLAITFHNSAVVFGIYFLLRIFNLRLSKKALLICLIFVSLSLFYGRFVLIVVRRLIPTRYVGLSLTDSYAINPLIIAIAVLIPLFTLVFSKTGESGKYDETATMMFLFSLLNVLFTCLSIHQSQIGRLVYYFSNSNVILISKAIDDTSSRNRLVIIPILMLLCLVFFYLGTSGGTLQIDNYLFYWQG